MASETKDVEAAPVTLAGVTRWPSSSVSVRMVPRLRRLNELNPCIPLLVLLEKVVRPVLPWSAGNCAMASNRLGSATFSMSALDSTVVGVGCVKPAEVIRDPVTTTASSDSSCVSAARDAAADRTNNEAQQTYKSRPTVGISLGPHTTHR